MQTPANSMPVPHQLHTNPMLNLANLTEIPCKSYIANPMPIVCKSYTNPVELVQIKANPMQLLCEL